MSKGIRQAEYDAARARVLEDLPADVRSIRHQWLGHVSSGCTATHSVHEGCDFSCTACYLSNTANRTPPLPMDEVKRQLDTIRAHAGPGGKTQITAGEVTLLPVEELAAVIRYARSIELDPMVMTHGQTFETQPGYLDQLMVDGGLEKVAIHIDSTQRGRLGFKKGGTETELMQVRDRFAEMVRTARRRTGKKLHAAHTVTVTQDNLHQVPAITEWFGRNADAFRMLSFQPTAEVGRTRVREVRVGESVWDQVRKGANAELNPHTFVMGHPDCNRVCLSFVVKFGNQVRFVEIKREHSSLDQRFFDEIFRGDSFRGFHLDGGTLLDLAIRLGDLFRRAPRYLWQWPAFALYRLAGERDWLRDFLRTVARGEAWSIHPTIMVVHNFMSSAELQTDLGKQRLAACSFKVPVDGEMISMCELNGTELRQELNVQTQARLVPFGKRTQADG